MNVKKLFIVGIHKAKYFVKTATNTVKTDSLPGYGDKLKIVITVPSLLVMYP